MMTIRQYHEKGFAQPLPHQRYPWNDRSTPILERYELGWKTCARPRLSWDCGAGVPASTTPISGSVTRCEPRNDGRGSRSKTVAVGMRMGAEPATLPGADASQIRSEFLLLSGD